MANPEPLAYNTQMALSEYPVPDNFFHAGLTGIALWPQCHLGSSILVGSEILFPVNPNQPFGGEVSELLGTSLDDSQLQAMAEMINRRHKFYQIPVYHPRASHIYSQGRKLHDAHLHGTWSGLVAFTLHRLIEYAAYSEIHEKIWPSDALPSLAEFIENPLGEVSKRAQTLKQLLPPLIKVFSPEESKNRDLILATSAMYHRSLLSSEGIKLAKSHRQAIARHGATPLQSTPEMEQMHARLTDQASKLMGKIAA